MQVSSNLKRVTDKDSAGKNSGFIVMEPKMSYTWGNESTVEW